MTTQLQMTENKNTTRKQNLVGKFLGGLLLPLMLAACHSGKVNEESAANFSQSNSDRIIGGEIVDQTSWLSKTVVALYARSPDGKGGSLCTGVLIDRNIILTAAHCVVSDSVNPAGIQVKQQMRPQQIIAIFTRNVDACSQAAAQQAFGESCVPARVEEILVHPAYFQENSEIGGDIALIRIQGVAPAGYVASSLTSKFIDPRVSPYVAAGFGRVNGYTAEQVEDSELRTVTLGGLTEELYQRLGEFLKARLLKAYEDKGLQATPEYAQVQQYSPVMVGEYFFPTAPDSEVIPVDNSQGKGICAGDSGGAAFTLTEKGTYVVTGVASTVGNPLGDEPCALVGNYMSVQFHKDWINLNFQRIRSVLSTKATVFETAI